MSSANPDPNRILKEHELDTSQPTLGTGIDWNEFHTANQYPGSTD